MHCCVCSRSVSKNIEDGYTPDLLVMDQLIGLKKGSDCHATNVSLFAYLRIEVAGPKDTARSKPERGFFPAPRGNKADKRPPVFEGGGHGLS